MKIKALSFALILSTWLIGGCTGFIESVTGSVAGNTAFFLYKKHLAVPASESRIYALPSGRMIRAVHEVFQDRGLVTEKTEYEGEEPSIELVAGKPLASEPMDPEILVVVKPLSTTRSQIDVHVQSIKAGRSQEDDQSLSKKLIMEINRKVMWG
jgi:hypothetical protein